MDIQTYFEELDENTTSIVQLVQSCPENQLHVKQGEAWSVMEILEHILLTERVVISLISRPSERLHTSEALFGKEKMFHLLVTRRDKKIEAPVGLHPKGNLTTSVDFEKQFVTQRNLLKQHLLDGTIVIDSKMHKHPFLGDMPIADWLYMIIHHSLRHAEQIKAARVETKG